MNRMLHRWRVESGMIYKLPRHWQGKMTLASELGVPLCGLPYSGADEVILFAKNGAELDRRLSEELERRRKNAMHLFRFLSHVFRTLFYPTPVW